MTDPFFKVSDVKSLKELAHVLTYPTIAVAYFLQSGPSIGWADYWHWGIPATATPTLQLFFFFIYFTLKAIWICSAVAVVDAFLTHSNWHYIELILTVVSLVFIGVGLMGLFAHDSSPQLSQLNKFWFFAFLVWGFASSVRLDRIKGIPK